MRITCCYPILAAGLFALHLLPGAGITGQERRPGRFGQGAEGMAAAGTPYATQAAVAVLERGGNAVDAAAAAHSALMVTDPANASLGGRVQVLICLKDGTLVALDGATQAPAGVMALSGPDEDRQGHRVAPIPGNPAALEEMVRRYGRLKLGDVLQPAIELAERGFAVGPRQAVGWERVRNALRAHPGAAMIFLKPDGSAFAEGDVFVQPRLAGSLRVLAESGVSSFYGGSLAGKIAADSKASGGYLTEADLEGYRVMPGNVVRTRYRDLEVAAAGGRAWGDTLAQMLNMLEYFPIGKGDPTADELEILAHVMAQALEDRPQEIGTLKPKRDGLELSTLSSPEFAEGRAAAIRQRIKTRSRPPGSGRSPRELDTTHLSIIDREGNAVSLTTSIGPSFGSRVATPELGFLYAHSYRMRSDPCPGCRDETEMTPTILLRDGKPFLVIGAAGSERIPTAILQVISHVVDRGYSLERAVAAPRLFCLGNRLQMQPGFPPSLPEALSVRGFEVEYRPEGLGRHLGIIHAVSRNPQSGEFFGAADPEYDGSAAGPARARR